MVQYQNIEVILQKERGERKSKRDEKIHTERKRQRKKEKERKNKRDAHVQDRIDREAESFRKELKQ